MHMRRMHTHGHTYPRAWATPDVRTYRLNTQADAEDRATGKSVLSVGADIAEDRATGKTISFCWC